MTVSAFLIDPVLKSVSVVEIEPGNLQSYYTALDIDTFTAVYPPGMPEGDCLYVDDNGLLYSPEKIRERGFFVFAGYPQPLAGRGLVLGSDDEGGTTAPRMTLDEVKARVTFPGLPGAILGMRRRVVVFS